MAPLGTSALFHVARSQLPSWGWTCTIASLMGQSCSRLAASAGCLAIWSQGEEAEAARLHEGKAQNWRRTASYQSIVWGKQKSLGLCRWGRGRTCWRSCSVAHIARDTGTEMWAHNRHVCMQLCKSSWGLWIDYVLVLVVAELCCVLSDISQSWSL